MTRQIMKPLDCEGIKAGGRGKIDTLQPPWREGFVTEGPTKGSKANPEYANPAKPKPAFTWERIDAVRVSAGIREDDVPPGAFTLGQYAEQYRIGERTAARQLRILVQRGALRTGIKRTGRSDGRRTLTNHYWPA